jgi:putative transposase
MIVQWKAENPSLNGVHCQVLQEVCTRVDLAFQAFFRRIKAGEEKVGYPRFRGRDRYDSFTFPHSGFKLLGNQLTLSKIGDVKIELHRPIGSKVKTLTLRRDAAGNWYACFSCECDIQPLPPVAKVVGVDLGLSTFAYLSTGEKIARQRWMKEDDRDIARLQRRKEQFAIPLFVPYGEEWEAVIARLMEQILGVAKLLDTASQAHAVGPEATQPNGSSS